MDFFLFVLSLSIVSTCQSVTWQWIFFFLIFSYISIFLFVASVPLPSFLLQLNRWLYKESSAFFFLLLFFFYIHCSLVEDATLILTRRYYEQWSTRRKYQIWKMVHIKVQLQSNSFSFRTQMELKANCSESIIQKPS